MNGPRHQFEDRYGLIDKRGDVILPPKFDNIERFDEGRIKLFMDRNGFIDTTGKEYFDEGAPDVSSH